MAEELAYIQVAFMACTPNLLSFLAKKCKNEINIMAFNLNGAHDDNDPCPYAGFYPIESHNQMWKSIVGQNFFRVKNQENSRENFYVA